ncbi:MAG: hypothetical protein HOI89_08270 [Phycisphaerae bacterium]|nr:hypothetical protein [Phycisphaerae bacterium]
MQYSTWSPWLARVACLVIAAAWLSQLGGCNIAQAVETLTRPDPVEKAKYDLPDLPTVVMFDDYYSVVTPVRIRRDIAEEATIVLMERADMDDMVSPLDAIRMAKKMDKSVERAAIHEVGKAIGVDQVIYVEPLRFLIPAIVGTSEPMAAFRVKVIDVKTGKRVFPADEKSGWSVQVSIPRAESQRIASSGPSAIRKELATRSGDAIASLFFDIEYSQHGNRLLGQ